MAKLAAILPDNRHALNEQHSYSAAVRSPAVPAYTLWAVREARHQINPVNRASVKDIRHEGLDSCNFAR